MSARHARRRPLHRAAQSQDRGLKAAVGDRITVSSPLPGTPVRDGVIVEVQHGDGSPPYVVHWLDNNQRALLYPGANASIYRPARSA